MATADLDYSNIPSTPTYSVDVDISFYLNPAAAPPVPPPQTRPTVSPPPVPPQPQTIFVLYSDTLPCNTSTCYDTLPRPTYTPLKIAIDEINAEKMGDQMELVAVEESE